MRRLIVPLFLFALTGLALSIYGIVRVSGGLSAPATARASEQDAIAAGLSIPAFRGVDQDGAERSEALLDGRLTVVAFIFTHCPFACPMMTASMNELSERLKDTPVRFASISVDPAHDTPARLKEYASANAADTSRWSFLSLQPGPLSAVLRSALGFELQPDDARKIPLPGGGEMSNIVHPTKLLLVGPDRRVLGFFESAIPDDVAALGRRARQAAAELRLTP